LFSHPISSCLASSAARRRAGNAGGRADFVHLGAKTRLSLSTTPATYSLPERRKASFIHVMNRGCGKMRRVLSHVGRYQPPSGACSRPLVLVITLFVHLVVVEHRSHRGQMRPVLHNGAHDMNTGSKQLPTITITPLIDPFPPRTPARKLHFGSPVMLHRSMRSAGRGEAPGPEWRGDSGRWTERGSHPGEWG
jgi:hypothetical protein